MKTLAFAFRSILVAVCVVLVGVGFDTSAEQPLRIEQNGTAHELHWGSENGTTSFLQHSHDLSNWQYTPHYHVGDGSARTQTLGEDLRPVGNEPLFYRLLLHPTNPEDPDDTDGDGLPNSFELAHSGTNPTLSDTDNDGYGDLEELYALNSDPNDWTPAFTFVDDTLDSDGDGLANYLERMIGTDPHSPGDVMEEPEPQDIDSDGDGLKDSEETTTDPSLHDTDGDGYGDGWELTYNMDPLDPMDVYDALDFWMLPQAYRLATGLDDWGDEDGDYLSNVEEFWEGTDPLLRDTDGDGVSDGEEVYFNGTDPTDGLPYYRDEDGDGLTAWEEGLLGTSDLLLDSDNDEISDFEEVKVQNVYLAQFGLPGFDPADPLDGQADWDLDGVTNADEIAAGTDYLNMDGDGDGIANFAELKLGTDPLAANDFGNSDLDGDGLSTLAERNLATNDLSADTDGDGLSDYLEGSNESPFASYLSPLDGDDALADLDGDGLSTIYEISIMLNSGGAGSSGEADQFDPLDYHPDKLVQYNYDPGTPNNGNFDPANQDSNGNGIPDGEDDVDGDGLSASQEYNYRTEPLKKDTDNDDVLDNEDGWAGCIDLAPKRIGKRTYAIIKVKEFPETTGAVTGEINNNGHWLIKTYSNIQHAGRSTTPHFYYDGETVTALPEFSGDDRPYRYEKLNEEGYFLRASWHIGKLTQDYSSPGALYRGIELKGEMPFTSSVFTAGFSFYELRGYEYFSSVTNAGTVYSHAYRETSPKPAGIPAPAAEYAGFYRIFNALGTPKAIEPQIAGVAAGDGDGKSGFTYTSDSPLHTVRKGDPNDNDPPYVGTPTWVTGGSISNIYTTNAQDLSLAFRTKLDKFWRDSSTNTQHGTVTHSLETWDGEKFSSLGQAVDNEQWRDYWPGPSFTQHRVSYSLAAHLNNKNTILLDSDIWLDTKAGLHNDQPVDDNPIYKRITWDIKWGDHPPRNLNTQMQGYASGSSRIWQNGYWLDLEADKLLGNSDYTDIKICDINDHGMLAAQATDAAGIKCAVFLVPVDIVPDYNRDGKIDEEDRGKVTEENPWRWWINDDNDLTVEERSGNLKDIPKQDTSVRDCNDLKVDGIRDLIDFFPLHLDLKQALEVLPESDYKYVLKHEEEALKFYEYPACVIDGSSQGSEPNRHVKIVGVGRGLATKELKLASSTGSELSAAMLTQAKQGNGVVVIEGVKKTEKPLVLEILKKSDNSSAAKIEFPMHIVDVEDMYRHVNMRASGGNTTQKNEPSAYPDDLTNGKYVAYIHGFNVSGESARGSQSNIYKRLHHLGNKARFIGVFWDGNPDNPLGLQAPAPDYHAAVFNGLIGGLPLKNHLAFAGGANLTILAHSLGNSIAGSAIALHGLDVSHYYIINGAIPLQAYDEDQTDNSNKHPDMKRSMTEDDWKPYYDFGRGERLLAANWHDLFKETPLDNRNKLTWNNLFKKPELLAVTYNFYSSSDEVVENADEHNEEFFANIVNAVWTWDFSRHAWVQQEIGKGGQSLIAHTAFRDINAGWKFNFRTHDGEVGVSEWEYGYYLEYLFSGSTLHRKYKPDEADSQISDADLREKPFYKPFPYLDLYDSDKGSAIAGETINRYKLLATGIPATSYAIAANSSRAINPSRNFNMSAEMKSPTGSSSWPADSSQENPEDWLHSDFKDVAMHFVHPMYRKMIGLAELDKK